MIHTKWYIQQQTHADKMQCPPVYVVYAPACLIIWWVLGLEDFLAHSAYLAITEQKVPCILGISGLLLPR